MCSIKQLVFSKSIEFVCSVFFIRGFWSYTSPSLCCLSVLKHIVIPGIEVIINPMPIPPTIKRPCEELPYPFRTKIIYNNILLQPDNLFPNLQFAQANTISMKGMSHESQP